jgi:hypothetical protein
MRPALLGLLLLHLSACPGGHVDRPYPAPDANAVIQHITSIKDRASSLKADTKTDFRLGKDRVNLTVNMLAAWGGKLRFQAEDPNNAMAADLASDGQSYCFIDVHHNCGECGPATAETVARMIRIPLEPDEVVAVLLGTAPVIDKPDEAKLTWDADAGHEVLTVKKDGWTEVITLDGAEKRWDVLEAVETSPDGKQVWRLRHKDFHDVKGVRLPGTSLFEQAGDSVRISWRSQTVGEPLNEAKAFHIELQPGLPVCQASP